MKLAYASRMLTKIACKHGTGTLAGGRAYALFAVALACSACGGANPPPRSLHGTLDLTALPAPGPSPFGTGSGHVQARVAQRTPSRDSLDAYLKRDAPPRRVAAASPGPKLAKAQVKRMQPVPAFDAPRPVFAAAPATPAARPTATSTDSQRYAQYAQRDNVSRNQQRFAGGERVVLIGVTTLIVILLVVLLIVLLL